MWEIHKDIHYNCVESYRPKKTVAEKKEWVLKCMVSFPIEAGKKYNISKQDKDDN